MSRYQNINPQTLNGEFISGGRPHLVVDVRTPAEYAAGHIPGAVNMPLDMLEYRTNDLPHDKALVVVCASGGRSVTASNMLTRAGFTNVYNVTGGTFGWQSAGFRTE
jgi:phage shock protein E